MSATLPFVTPPPADRSSPWPMIAEGVLAVEVGENRFEAEPQTLVWLPRQVPHMFANLSDEEVWTVGIITPTGLESLLSRRAV